ncbi:MAG TPA: tRNA (N(6)-L-threonylcarbamoyladenosine(37)-C(2))-methylthiotransferase MtaB [Candidatus Binatia bacterium]|nr:tRNA (N(6)-L-threonylcarbamoyladenosine(37)-C(2))-methylthiotransferase MtaB [Candidatus Binatia bacterium]
MIGGTTTGEPAAGGRVRERTVSFTTLGCRLNQVESQEMAGLLERQGFRVAGDERPDVCVVNTCTVTGRADLSDRQAIRRLARENPGALLVVTGCYAQTDADAVARIPGVDLVLGNLEKYRLHELLEGAGKRAGPAVHVGDVAGARGIPRAPFSRVIRRSRAFVKVQDGCQHRCAFCIVPAARGASRSQEPRVVVDQVRLLVEAGYREVTLTGVDLGHYGWDLAPRGSLAGLVRAVEDEVPGLSWLRLSSVLPAYFTPELFDVIEASRVLVPHFHVPLQSGSDRVLRIMRRPYNTRMYRRVIERLAARREVGLGADVIAGHPGETEADFAETVALIADLPFSYLHVFSYSDRRGTEAARLGDRSAAATVTGRSRRLRALGAEKSLAFRRRLVGRTVPALVLESRDRATGLLAGLTASYVEVALAGPDGLGRRIVPVAVTEAVPGATRGRLAGEPA